MSNNEDNSSSSSSSNAGYLNNESSGGTFSSSSSFSALLANFLSQFDSPLYISVLSLSAVFTIAAVLISMRSVALHLRHYTKPEHNKNIIRILILVPIYAVDSWLSLFFRRQSWFMFIDLVRDW